MAQSLIHQHDRKHRFGDRCRADADARIMPSVRVDDDGAARFVDRTTVERIEEVGLTAIDTTMSCPVEIRRESRRRCSKGIRPESSHRSVRCLSA
jgi:hypothetical protein